jgi:predicted TPR repeat methyltransferase
MGSVHYDEHVAPFIAPYTEALLHSLKGTLDPGQRFGRHLDHGAGTGAVTFALRAAGLTATSVAIDPGVEMIDRLKAKADADSFSANSWLTTRAQTLGSALAGDVDLIGAHDLVTSQLAIAFVPDPGPEL